MIWIGIIIGIAIGIVISAFFACRMQKHACKCLEDIRKCEPEVHVCPCKGGNMGDYGFDGAGEFGGTDFPDLPAESSTESTAGTPREFELYKDTAGEFRWRLRATNGRIIASSSDGYINKADAEHAINLVKNATASTTVQDLT